MIALPLDPAGVLGTIYRKWLGAKHPNPQTVTALAVPPPSASGSTSVL